ncbi:MAG: penicillin acylase family protein, partial [Acidobacteriota bacterium]
MRIRSPFQLILLGVISIQLILPIELSWRSTHYSGITRSVSAATNSTEITPVQLPDLLAKVDVIEDQFGIPHIFAKRMEDAVFMQGFLHARDRFFQMDVTRRTIEGTSAELLGAGEDNINLNSDIQLRGLGITRASQTAFSMLRPETRRLLKAYTKGVNSYLANNPLPAEYQALKLTQKRMWKEVDSINVGKAIALSLSFDVSDISNTMALRTYEAAGKAQGFDGTALFFNDLFRSAPFEPAFSIPDALGQQPTVDTSVKQSQKDLNYTAMRRWSKNLSNTIKPETMQMAKEFVERLSKIPFLAHTINSEEGFKGSNWFVLGGQHTQSGVPLMASDPHLSLSTAPVWYQVQLNVSKKNKTLLNVIGVSFPGAPGVVLGHNDDIAWGATTAGFDVTDVYQEEIAAEFGALFIVNNGKREQVMFRDETFRVNQVTPDKNDNIVVVPPNASIPARFPSVPRRNNGPIIAVDLNARAALSVQFTGFGPTLELETFLDFDRAKTVQDFQNALRFFDFGAQHFCVVTSKGDIASFTSGEIPLREDLEAGKVNGAPPFFIRDGRGGNEWQTIRNRQPNQSLPTEILPAQEMPQVINPTRGFIVSANNDPAGTTANNRPLEKKRANGGIYYLSAGYANGIRAARIKLDIEQAIRNGGKITTEQARRFQASVQMRDAEVFMPFIRQAFENAQKPDAPPQLTALAMDAGVREAMDRFATWDFTTPTGLRVGFDSFVPFNQSEPSEAQINNSVSTTIYSLWRSQVVQNTIDKTLMARQLTTVPRSQIVLAALRNLLENFSTGKGVGASGIDFFAVASLSDATPETRRDFILLQSLRQALDVLAGPDFQAAFNGSTNQRDYRWGLLHRVVFEHPLGITSEFSIPSDKSNFRAPFPGLLGLPRDGGFEVPNASSHSVRGRAVDDFMFFGGPSQRLTVVLKPGAIEAINAIPGGQKEAINSPFRDNLLNFWLVANGYPF